MLVKQASGYIESTLHSLPSSCSLCQPVLIVSTSDKKYRFGVPFKVLVKQASGYIESTLHSLPSSCSLCQPVLIVSTSDKKYRFGVPFKVLSKLLVSEYTSLSPLQLYTSTDDEK